MKAPSGITAAIQPIQKGFNGAMRPEHQNVHFVRPHACPRCSGMGYIWEGEDTEDCPVCKGRGIQ